MLARKQQTKWCETDLDPDDVWNSLLLLEAFGSTEQQVVANLAVDHRLFLPLLHVDAFKIVAETANSVLCIVGKSNTTWSQMVHLAEKEKTMGGVVHKPFHEFVVKHLQVYGLYENYAKRKNKKLVFAGHSTGGSVANVAALLVHYQYSMPMVVKRFLNRDGSNFEVELEKMPRDVNAVDVYGLSFGGPCFGDGNIKSLVKWLQLDNRFVNVVNEMDCIPAMMNVAQSMSMVAKTSTRILTLRQSIGAVLTLLFPGGAVVANSMQVRFTAFLKSTYAKMLLSMLSNAMEKLELENVLGYAPVGTYVYLYKNGQGRFKTSCDGDCIEEEFLKWNDTSLVGDHFLQHSLQAYRKSVQFCMVPITISETQSYYQRLGLPSNASARDIRTAYRTFALKWHPDKWSGKSDEERDYAESVFKLLAEAFEVLSDPVSRRAYDDAMDKEEQSFATNIFRTGTMGGMTVDEAIAQFSAVAEQCSGVFSKIKSTFSASSSTATVSTQANSVNRVRFQSGNHDNLFMANKMRVLRELQGDAISAGASNQKVVTYIDADDMLPTDVAAPVGSNTGIRSTSIVGGAVALGASVAIIIGVWSKYSASTKTKRQVEVLRLMDGEYLARLAMDTGSSQNSTNALAICDSEMDEFYDCHDQLEAAICEAELEEIFFDCLDIDIHSAKFPPQTTVTTPFGIGVVLETLKTDIVLVDVGSVVAYVHGKYLALGAIKLKKDLEAKLETKREQLITAIITRYELDTSFSSGHLWDMLNVGKLGAIDGGLKAAGGVAISKSVGRFAQSFAATSAAPLALASIMVDIGKDYRTYRNEVAMLNSEKIASASSELLLMHDFRENAGSHIVSGVAAASGAGISAYAFSTTASYFATTGAFLSGPLGLLAATGFAVAGGVLGYVSGSKAYAKTRSVYFSDYYKVREEISRLELGARVLFNEFDPENNGQITHDHCKKIIIRLKVASNGSVSDESVHEAIAYLDTKHDSDYIEWDDFWHWISKEAYDRLHTLTKTVDTTTVLDAFDGSQDTIYPEVFAQLGFRVTSSTHTTQNPLPKPYLANSSASFYPQVYTTLGYLSPPNQLVAPFDIEDMDDIYRDEFARIDHFVQLGLLSSQEEWPLKSILRFGSIQERRGVCNTLEALARCEEDNLSNLETERAATTIDEIPDPQIDHLNVLCSLLSINGLKKLLNDYGIDYGSRIMHEELHSLVLLNATTILQCNRFLPPHETKSLLQ